MDNFKCLKFGVQINFGLYSIPAYAQVSQSKVFNYVQNHKFDAMCYGKKLKTPFIDTYATEIHHYTNYGNVPYDYFSLLWNPCNFNVFEWLIIFKRANVKYIIVNAKYMDGWCNWPSQVSPNNSLNKIDFMIWLKTVFEINGIKFGISYSLHEWDNGLYESDKLHDKIRKRNCDNFRYIENVVKPHIHELMSRYNPSYFWFENDGSQSSQYWKSLELINIIRSYNPDTLINNKLGHDISDNLNFVSENNLVVTTYTGRLPTKFRNYAWECNLTIGSSFSHNKYESIEHKKSNCVLIKWLVKTVSLGGNLLLHIGPTEDGKISSYDKTTLINMGRWIEANGVSLFNSIGVGIKYNFTHENNFWYLYEDKCKLYGILLEPKRNNVLTLHNIEQCENFEAANIIQLNNNEDCWWRKIKNGIEFMFYVNNNHVFMPIAFLFIGFNINNKYESNPDNRHNYNRVHCNRYIWTYDMDVCQVEGNS